MNGGYAPPRAFLAIIVAAVCEGMALSPQRIASHGDENRRVMLWNIAHGVAVLICLQAFTMMANTSPPGGGNFVLFGISLLVFGLALRTAAIQTLSEHFSDGFEPSAEMRVVTGPYRFVGHPAELGLLLIIAGFGTLVCGWSRLTVMLFVALTVASAVRVILEERALRGLAGNETVARLGCGFSGDHIRHDAAVRPFRIADIIEASEPISAQMGNACR